MSPATRPPATRDAVRLLLVDAASGAIHDGEFAELIERLRAGDLLVVNDAATLPASLLGSVRVGGEAQPVEVRLLGLCEADDRWRAVLFGRGDWRVDTNHRPPPPRLEVGASVELRGGLRAEVVARDRSSDRLIELHFDRSGSELHAALYVAGQPVQYSHLEAPLELWSVQTVFASRPWAVEMPSAGRPLTATMLAALRRRGVELARLTHAAGLSATGDAQLDAMLPLPERYEIPSETVAALARTHARNGRVIAIGTTVVRALEGAAERDGTVRPGPGVTDLIITPERPLRIVDALLTGMHEPSESHYRLLGAFAPPALLARAWARALASGYCSHEFGDVALLWSERARGVEPTRTE
ncbi:MAG TPA: S-adenosylmethionine:tRNA ribosyltransferase-isomerase [Enhygromyxa sp.]|nr:S-adenosylmethionine:tRNA ribosyltransferase-isomerase [Enhygromyxa sp.]